MFINATTRQQISIYSIGPYWLLACTPHIWKSGGTKKFFSLGPLANPVLYPHLKIRGAAHGYAVWFISCADTEVWPESSLNCDRQQFVEFRGALRSVTGSRARGRMGCSRMPQSLVFPQSFALPLIGVEVTLWWPYQGCPKISSTVGARFNRASLINTAQSPSIIPLPLHYSTLTYLLNLGYQAAQWPTDPSGQKATALEYNVFDVTPWSWNMCGFTSQLPVTVLENVRKSIVIDNVSFKYC